MNALSHCETCTCSAGDGFLWIRRAYSTGAVQKFTHLLCERPDDRDKHLGHTYCGSLVKPQNVYQQMRSTEAPDNECPKCADRLRIGRCVFNSVHA